MIAQSAVRKFLARPMRDSATAKELALVDIDRMIEHAGLEFHTKPRHAQKVCTLLGWIYPAYLFLLGMGAGKSKLCLDLFVNRRRVLQENLRCLVIVPNVINLNTWQIEVGKHTVGLKVGVLDEQGEGKRWAVLESSADVCVGTYQGIAKLVSDLHEQRGSTKRKMKLHGPTVKKLAALFDFVVFDEITAIKNNNSLWFRMARMLRKNVDWCYGLTGTPFEKKPLDLWSQFFVIDGGNTLGETLGLYREVFFAAKDNYWGGAEYTFKHKMVDTLARRLRNISVRYSEEECQDLPPAVGGLSGDLMLVPVTMTKEQFAYYDKLDEELMEHPHDWALVEAAYLRMRMVTSGWVGAKTDEGEKVEITFKHNPKFDAVCELLDKIDESEKVVIVCWFNATCRLLVERLKAEKHRVVLINGKTPTQQKNANMASFCSENGARVLVASTAISKGVNLQSWCKYMLFVETPDSTIERRQMEARIRRERENGDKGSCYYYEIVVNGSVDQKILKSLVAGKKLHDVLIDS